MATLEDGRSGLTRAADWVGSGRDRKPISVLFGASVAISGLLLLILGAQLTFLLDDWTFLLYRPGLSADSVLTPHGEHIVAGPVLLYKLLQSTIGMESALPYRVISVSAFLVSAVLLFVYLRRRIDPWLALAAGLIVLFLGPAWEDLLWPFQVGFFTAMSAGLGMLLCLERDDRKGNLGACALLSLAVVFSSLGLPFAVAAAVVVLRGPHRWRRLYVVLVPLVIYGIWYIGWGRDAESAVSLENLATTPMFVLDSVAAAAASVLGLATPHSGAAGAGMEWGRPIVVALVILGAWRLHRMGRIPTWLWTVVALGASFWIFAGLNEKEGRAPTVSRYQYVGAIFLILIAAEFMRGFKLNVRGLAVLAVVLGAVLVSNIYYLGKAYDSYHQTSQLERGALGAVEIAADTVEPGFLISEDLADTAYVHVEAAAFLDAADQYGSPAYSSEELTEAPENVRFAADKVLSAALRISYEPLPAGADVETPAAVTPTTEGAVPVASESCVKVADSGPGALVTLPPEGAVVAAQGTPVASLSLRRFSSGAEFPVNLESAPAAGEAAAIRIPPDRSSVPWQLRVQGAGTATVCGPGMVANPSS